MKEGDIKIISGQDQVNILESEQSEDDEEEEAVDISGWTKS